MSKLHSSNTSYATPLLGCIADDFTGASDLASFLVESGMKTLQINGLPCKDDMASVAGFDAVVIALKSRTAPPKEAVNESLKALTWLEEVGCHKFYFKYCSTFDSTDEGNIGLVIDALLDHLNEKSTVICPALPVNGRTVYQGHLFVNGQLLNESSMKDHPLTPMRDSNLVRMIEKQGCGKAINIPLDIIEGDEQHLAKILNKTKQKFRYLITDCVNQNNLAAIGHSVSSFKLVTGGSGLAFDLCYEFEQKNFTRKSVHNAIEKLNGKTLIFSGSCSAMTQSQVNIYQQDHPSLYIDALKLNDGSQNIDTITQWLKINIHSCPLIFSTANTETVDIIHKTLGKEKAQNLLESTFSSIAINCIKQNVKNFIVAGGETSGAVVSALNLKKFHIGASISPGVPILQSVGDKKLNLVLKSGNFGNQHFFEHAVEALL